LSSVANAGEAVAKYTDRAIATIRMLASRNRRK
jgi:hypothetical protein